MYLKSIVCCMVLAVAVAESAVQEHGSKLKSEDLAVQGEARAALMTLCSNAGRPGAEDERIAVCKEICLLLSENQPVEAVMLPLLQNLQWIGGEESVKTLAKLLGHSDPHVRDYARRALVANSSPAAGRVLLSRLASRAVRDSIQAVGFINGVAERGEVNASEVVSGYLNASDDRVVVAAIKALGRLNEEEGIRALLKYRSKANGFALFQTDAALFGTDRTPVFRKLYGEDEPLEVRAIALLGLVVDGDMDAALDGLASGNPVLQMAVIEGVRQSGIPGFYDLVAAHFPRFSPELQVQALGVLEHSAIRTYAAPIQAVLAKTQDESVRAAALQALGRIGTSADVATLVDVGTQDAKDALVVLNADGVDRELERIMTDQGSSAAQRALVIGVLAGRGRADLLPDFLAYAGESGEVAGAAIEAIATVGDLDSLEQLTESMIANEQLPLARDMLRAIVEIIRKSADPARAVDVLVRKMDGASTRSQANILQALAQTGREEALGPIVEACKSSDEALRKLGIKLLAGWPSAEALSSMLDVAADQNLSMANHVVLMRGVSRIFSGQKRLDKKAVERALAVCRRDEERNLIRESASKK